MARKSSAAAEFIAVTEYQHELATEVCEAQDDETKKGIDKLYTVLRSHSTGARFDLTDEQLEQALFVIAVESVKDLALLDIRIGTFKFDESTCVKCGGEV